MASGDFRRKKCQEILGSEDFKKVSARITYDDEQNALALRKCQFYVIEVPQKPNAPPESVPVKLCKCPFREHGRLHPGVYYMFQGSNSNEVFLSIDGDTENEKKPAAWYSPKRSRGK